MKKKLILSCLIISALMAPAISLLKTKDINAPAAKANVTITDLTTMYYNGGRI